MAEFVIERTLPGAGKLTRPELKAIAHRSRTIIEKLGPDIRWHHTYVTDDKVFCVYSAPSPELIREHARMGGFPCDRILVLRHVITPATADD